jgi:TRAP-type C4-dicarboxylate transport system permease small subunit
MRMWLNRFEAGFHWLLHFLGTLVAITIGLIAVLIPLNLLLIRLQWGSIWWLHEAVEYSLYVGVFLGAPWVLQQGAHVRVDVLVAALPDRAAVQLERLLDGFGSALCLVLCFYGIRGALSEFADGTLPDKDLRIANWYMVSVFAVSFFLLAVEFLLRLRRAETIVEEQHSAPSEQGF